MPTLSHFPLSHLALLCRIPFWAQALALCALFAIAGAAVLDDYGVTWDEFHQRRTAIVVADYAMGISEESRRTHDRYYGVAVDMPLLLAERAFGLHDSRDIYLTRHLLTHLFFIAGGFVCAMLAYRMIGSRWIAILAMLMFMLHPRLYAHSFFNTKDVPFAVLLVIALYLAHRAFRKDTIGAFLLCGIATGLAINLRVFALMLLPMILAMRALDLWQAGGGERKHILATAGVFAAAALGTAYMIHPYYWENPLRFIEGVRALSQHPTLIQNLFMGQTYWSDAVPWNYIPVWFAITAPPVALLLGSIGAAAVCLQAIAHPLAVLRARETRFRVLLLSCVVLPVAVVIALQSNIYTGWRQMYFLWAPFCLLAAVGLHIIRTSVWGGYLEIGARLPGWIRGCGCRLHMAQRALAYGIAGVGLLTTLTAMAALHPHQQVYFNALTDTKTPGALAQRYSMDYGHMAHRQLLEYLLARYPHDALRVWPKGDLAQILPQKDRDRLIGLDNPRAADFYLLNEITIRRFRQKPQEAGFFIHFIHPRVDLQSISETSPIHAVRAYGSAIALILPKDPKDAAAYRAAYADVVANGDPLARDDFDIYAYDGALYYLSADCPPPMSNEDNFWVFLHITPADLADLPAASREYGFENLDFRLSDRAAFFEGKCMHRQPLPDYPIERIATGAHMKGGPIWRADINLLARAAAQPIYEGIASGDYGQPVAQSHFDLYLRDNALTYLKEPCDEGDTDARFFLHIIPTSLADLPAAAREHGFANLDFHFTDHGAYAGDICVATRDLPDYPIERIRTGQHVSGEGPIWGVEFPAGQ